MFNGHKIAYIKIYIKMQVKGKEENKL